MEPSSSNAEVVPHPLARTEALTLDYVLLEQAAQGLAKHVLEWDVVDVQEAFKSDGINGYDQKVALT